MIGDFLDGHAGLGKEPGGVAHADFFNIIAEGHTGGGFYDAVHLALAVIEKGRQVFQSDGAVVFLHIFKNEDRIFIHYRRLDRRNDHILFMGAEQMHEEKG